MDLQDKELLGELVVESREHLAAIEPDLLGLEKEKDNVSPDRINRIFRAIHSIKGGFGFFGKERIKQLSHSMEGVLDMLRNGKVGVSPALIDVLFKGIDKLKAMLEDVESSESVSIDAELQGLIPFLETQKALPIATPKSQITVGRVADQKAAPIKQELLINSIKCGKCIYRFTLEAEKEELLHKSSEWKKIGEILDIAPSPETIQKPLQKTTFTVVIATVLEPDLISTGVGLPDSSIEQVDVKALKESLSQEAKLNSKAQAKAIPIKEQVKGSEVSEAQNAETLRVRVGLLNNLMNLAGELVLSRNQLLQNMDKRLDEALDSDKIMRAFENEIQESLGRLLNGIDRNNSRLNEDKNKILIARAKQSLLKSLKQTLQPRLGEIPGFNVLLQNIDRVTTEMQENIMQTRLQPVSMVFGKFPRVVRDMAKGLKKEVRLSISGGDVELDKSIIEMLSDPLNHLVRNSVDHGIEPVEEREELGKTREGEIKLSAYHESGKVLIEVTDDGGGIDVHKVRDKAIEKGLLRREDAAHMGDKEILSFIFLPGFSTAKVVSDVSGRGVGMDVVKTNIERLGGTVELESEVGKGTRVIMKLPLTLAIIPSLIVSVQDRSFAIPQVSLEELVRIRARDAAKAIETVHGSSVLRLLGRLLPLVRLSDLLGIPRTYLDAADEKSIDRRERIADRRSIPEVTPRDVLEKREASKDRRTSSKSSIKIVVLKALENRFGLIVDEVYDNEEIIVKPLSSYLKKCQCYAGSAIMGDGKVAMILDSLGIAGMAGLKFAELEKESLAEKERHARRAISETQEILTFRNGTSETFAIDLSLVSRVEKVEPGAIERIGSKEFLKYEDKSLRLLRLHDYLPIQPPETGTDEAALFVIVPKMTAHPLGIIATSVEDIIHAQLDIDSKTLIAPGIFGTAMVNKQMLVFIDIYPVFEKAEPDLYGANRPSGSLDNKRVLLAEDTAFFRTVLENYLVSFGCKVDIVKDGDEAWQRLLSGERYSMLLTDVEMPGITVPDLVRKIKESPKLKGLPVIMLSTSRAEKIMVQCKTAGADACENKLDKGLLKKTMECFTGA